MNQTLAQEWQYARAWDGEASRADALEAYMDHFDWDRSHSACGGPAPDVTDLRRKQRHGTQQLALIHMQFPDTVQ